MKIKHVILLGITQGITEFIPVSSYGHLILIKNLFQIHDSGLIFDISLHVGTLTAVIIILHNELKSILKSILILPDLLKGGKKIKQLHTKDEGFHLLILVLVSSIPTAIIGFSFKNLTNTSFESTLLVGLMLLISGSFLGLTKNIKSGRKNISQVQIKDSILIGIFQGIATIPGISRSALTISTGLFLGINHETAVRFSFLLSIPAILGALTLSLCYTELQANDTAISSIIIGTTISAITGCLALKFILFIAKSERLHLFAPYCYILGFTLLLLTK